MCMAHRGLFRWGIVAAFIGLVYPSVGIAGGGSDFDGVVDVRPPVQPSHEQTFAERAELLAREAGILADPVYSRQKVYLPNMSPVRGLRFEVSVAPPASDIPTDPYELGKY